MLNILPSYSPIHYRDCATLSDAGRAAAAYALWEALELEHPVCNYGDGVLGTEVNGHEVTITVEEDCTVSVAVWAEDGSDIHFEMDDIHPNVDTIRDAVENLYA